MSFFTKLSSAVNAALATPSPPPRPLSRPTSRAPSRAPSPPPGSVHRPSPSQSSSAIKPSALTTKTTASNSPNGDSTVVPSPVAPDDLASTSLVFDDSAASVLEPLSQVLESAIRELMEVGEGRMGRKLEVSPASRVEEGPSLIDPGRPSTGAGQAGSRSLTLSSFIFPD